MGKRSALVLVIVLAIVGFFVMRAVQRDSEPKPALEAASSPQAEKKPNAVDLAASEKAADVARAVVAPAATAAAPADSAKPAMAKLEIHVVEKSSGRPLPKVSVSVVSKAAFVNSGDKPPAPAGWRDLTNAEGRLEFEFPGDAAIDVSVNGAGAEAGDAHEEVAPIGAGKTFTLEIALRTDTDSEFWVRAIDVDTRESLADARLLSSDAKNEKSKADSRGLLSTRTASYKPIAFRVEARDHAFAYVHQDAGHETADRALEIALPRAALVDAHVVDAAGASILGATVTITTHGFYVVKPDGTNLQLRAQMPDPIWRKGSRPEGHALFDELPPNVPLELTIGELPPGGPVSWRLPDAITLKAGEKRDIECRVGGGTLVEGRMTDQFGHPVKHRSVRLEPAQRKMPVYFQTRTDPKYKLADTDDDGHFAITDVAAGAWWIGPNAKREPHKEPEADDVAPVAQVLEIADGAKRMTVDIQVDRGLAIRGRVLDSHGAPPTRATVSAQASKGAASPYAFVEPDGSFTIGPIANGRFELRAKSFDGDAPSELVGADAGASGIVLQLRPGAELSGKIVDASGTAVAARVSATRVDAKPPSASMQDSTPAGEFVFKGLDAGTFDLVATTADGRLGTLEHMVVDAGAKSKDLVVHLQPAGRVRVRYAGDAKYATVSVISNGVTVDAQSIEKGATRELTAPLGKATLRLTVSGGTAPIDREIEVRAGDSAEIAVSETGR